MLDNLKIGPVAQLNRALDFGSNGWGFESLRGHDKHKTTTPIGVVVLLF